MISQPPPPSQHQPDLEAQPSFWERHYHGPRGPLADADDRRRAGLLHAFTGVGMISILFFGVQLVAKGSVQTALLDGTVGTLLGLNLLLLRWHRRPRPAAWVGLLILAVYLLVQLATGGDQNTGYLWTILFPPAAAFLLGFRHGLAFLALFLAALGWLTYGEGVLVGTGLPESLPTKLMGALILVSAFSFAFERARQRAQTELIEARDLAERSARLKGEFLANMSHEVRTPLNGIIGLAELLSKTDNPSEQRSHVGLIGDAARQLLELLNGILDLSKAEMGKLDFTPERVEFRPLLEQIVAFHRPRAEDKGIELALETGADAPDVLFVDPLRLRQVLDNLLSNAVKFTERGRIVLRCGFEASGASPDWVRVSISDSGVGVPPERADEIFDDFVQANGTSSRRFGGTGLGLAISKHLVERMGGQIGYRPGESGGSVFWFRLPIVEPTTLARPASAPSEERPGRVLVVDDNRINSLLLRKMLEDQGVHAEEAGGGQAALERWSSETWDVVLMDVQMPDMDGLEVTREIRAREDPSGRTPIVAVTAHAMDSDRQRCLDAGMDDYLVKPVREQELLAVLGRWIPMRDRVESKQSGLILDRSRLSISTRDDPDLERTLRQLFTEATPKLLEKIEVARQAGQASAIARLAHTLRGSCSTLGAQALGAAARQLEMAAEAGDLDRSATALELVQLEYTRLLEALARGGGPGVPSAGSA